MHIDGLRNYITEVDKIENPTVERVAEKDDESKWILYKCLENQKYYFTLFSKQSVLHSAASPELVEELQK
jgi:hypothetical protein